jgi:sulfonate transport system ATP-binding protein
MAAMASKFFQKLTCLEVYRMSKENKGTGISIQNLTKQFGHNTILENINLNIEQGEFVAIIGKSGCGKSTLLRLMAGLESPTDGNVLVEGENVSGYNPETRMLFQESRLLPWKSVIENVRIGTVRKDKELAFHALKEVGLEEKGKEWPRVLSGGQKQRVSLARALASKPNLLLLDEPLGALDALTRIEMQDLIERLWFEQGFTAVLVTHDVAEAVALADRVLLIEEGHVALDIQIPLARPRIRDNDFVYYERKILDRVMGKDSEEVIKSTRKIEYLI